MTVLHGKLNREYLGRSYSGGDIVVTPEMVIAYALATNDPNPHYLGEKEPFVAPPLFAVRLFVECMFKPLTDPGLGVDLLRLVHGEQDMRFYRPILPGDLCTLQAIVHGIEEKSSGELLRILMRCRIEQSLAVEAIAGMFIRGPRREPGEKRPVTAGRPAAAGAEAKAPANPEPLFRVPMEVTKDQTFRYAEASGDHNPIHVDDAVARMAGHPGVILQGLCTMAFCSRAIVQRACAGNPLRLKRLAVRFSKPVLPGDSLTTSAWKLGAEAEVVRYGFETTNQSGALVITNGLAEVTTG